MRDLIRNLNQILIVFLIFSVNFIVSISAWGARPSVVISQTGIPTIEVRSTNGQFYNVITQTKAITAWLSGNCAGDDTVFDARAYIENWPASAAKPGFIDNNLTELKPQYIAVPQWIIDGMGPYPDWLEQKLFDACNDNRGTVSTAEDFLIEVEIGQLIGWLTCAPKPFKEEIKYYNHKKPAKFKVNCKALMSKGPPPPSQSPPKTSGKGLVQAVKVTQANLIAFPDNKGGKCEVKLSATLVASGKTNVKYQFENQVGNRSGVETVNIDQTNAAFFTKTFDFAKSGKGIWWEAETGGGSGPTFATKPTDNKQGFFKLVVLSPNKFESNLANYNFKCEKPPTIKDPKLVAPKQPSPHQ